MLQEKIPPKKFISRVPCVPSFISLLMVNAYCVPDQCRHLTRRIFHISATLPSQFSHIYCTVYIYFPRCTVYSIHIFLHLVVLQYHILYITCILSIPDSCTVLHRFITPTCTKQIPKAVSASWRKEFIQFLASLAFLHQDNWTNRMMSS